MIPGAKPETFLNIGIFVPCRAGGLLALRRASKNKKPHQSTFPWHFTTMSFLEKQPGAEKGRTLGSSAQISFFVKFPRQQEQENTAFNKGKSRTVPVHDGG